MPQSATPRKMELTSAPSGEDVRLVIWDLDECWWRGTLGEDETDQLPQPVPEHVAIARSLALRGIVSSVCSRNDPTLAQRTLEALGAWDLFAFAAVSWDEPKVTPAWGRTSMCVTGLEQRAFGLIPLPNPPRLAGRSCPTYAGGARRVACKCAASGRQCHVPGGSTGLLPWAAHDASRPMGWCRASAVGAR